MEKENLYLSVAGFIIALSFTRSEEYSKVEDLFISLTQKYYKTFIVDYREKKVDYTIEIVHERSFHTLLEKNKKKMFINFYEDISSKRCRTFYHISRTQLQIIVRRITHALLAKNFGFILHASAVTKNKKAYIFLGGSGVGKSSIMTFLSPNFTPLGDDTVVIRKQEGVYFCYSSSAIEKNSWFPKNSKKVPLEKVFFLRQKNEHSVQNIRHEERIISLLSKQIYSGSDDLKIQFHSMSQFINSFENFYILDFALKDKGHLRDIILD